MKLIYQCIFIKIIFAFLTNGKKHTEIKICDMGVIPFKNEPDTIQFKVTSLQFYNNTDLVTRHYDHIMSPHIDVIFTPTIQIPKEMFKPGNVLDWTTGWTPEKAAFFGDHVISDLQVIGL